MTCTPTLPLPALVSLGLAILFTGICIGFVLADLMDRKVNKPESENMIEPPEFLKEK